MKKLFVVIFIAVIACFSFVGCNDNTEQIPPTEQGSGETSGSNDQTADSEEIIQPFDPELSDNMEITKMYITINGNKLEVTLAENSSVDTLVERLKKGDITYTANDYGGFEKVGSLGFSLPTNNTQITTQSGDVILYSGNQIVLFYGSNSWSYTRLGRINGYSVAELRTLLGAGNGSSPVTISLK